MSLLSNERNNNIIFITLLLLIFNTRPINALLSATRGSVRLSTPLALKIVFKIITTAIIYEFLFHMII